jgi:hypothetical protein
LTWFEKYTKIKNQKKLKYKRLSKTIIPVEIWEIAEPQGYREKLNLKGRTMPSAIGAQYIQISKIIKIQNS